MSSQGKAEPSLRLGSLFSGYGGLDLGVQLVLGGRMEWFAEVAPSASKILATHWPDIPNLGDITQIDWQHVPPVDVLTGGFPCQPVSLAGRREGTTDERWLFDDILTAIRNLDPQPQLCVFENVRGLLTANSGDAMARVVEGLASVGYVGTYGILPASAVGAPHRRERVFIVAHPRDDRRENPITRGLVSELPRAESDHIPLPGEVTRRLGLTLLPTPVADNSRGIPSPTTTYQSLANEAASVAMDFGDYAPAIHRWERITGRPAPPPTEPGPRGNPRLSPAFVEWLMGLPAGHVTNTGISRVAQLKALGNGVVPQQAAAAIRALLERAQP